MTLIFPFPFKKPHLDCVLMLMPSPTCVVDGFLHSLLKIHILRCKECPKIFMAGHKGQALSSSEHSEDWAVLTSNKTHLNHKPHFLKSWDIF